MKNSTKMIATAIAAVAMFIGTTVNVKAQDNKSNEWRLGVGITPAIPTGDAHDASKFALGGDLRLQYGVAEKLGITLTSGYDNFFTKSVTLPDGSKYNPKDLGVVPVKLGIKAYFAPSWYFGAEAGAGFETVSNGNTKLILSPGIGWSGSHWDVGARYENFSGQNNSYGFVGLRLAYGFAL